MGAPTASWSDRRTLPPLAVSVSIARGFVQDLLIEHDLQYLIEDVRLVASELATNAVRHARTLFTVMLEGLDDSVRLTVSDDSAARPIRSDENPKSIGGRGLNIVHGLSRDWGVTRGKSYAKSVWASFALDPGNRDKGRAVKQPRARTLTEPRIASEGSAESRQPEGLLPNLLCDVKEARAGLQTARARAGRSPEAVRAAHAHLVACLTLYVEALGSRRLPVPYLLRDELRLYGRTSAAYNTNRWG